MARQAPHPPAAGPHTVRVLRLLAANRLLPKEGWGLSRELCAAAVPFVKALLWYTYCPAAVTNILGGTTKRPLSVELVGDFTNYPHPLPLPESLVRLVLSDFTGSLAPLPPSLRCLHLSIHLDDGEDIINSGVQAFLGHAVALIRSAPQLEELYLFGPFADEGEVATLRLCCGSATQIPLALKTIKLENWDLESWESIQLLLSPEVAILRFENCHFKFSDAATRESITMFPLPEQLVTLELDGCGRSVSQLIFHELPATLRGIFILSSAIKAIFTQGLPAGLVSFALGSLDHEFGISAHMLPQNLEELWVGGRCEPLETLPPRLRVLKMTSYEHELPQLPDTLETLELHDCDHDVVQLPERLRSLSLSCFRVNTPPLLPTGWPPLLEHLSYWTDITIHCLSFRGCL
ncbi:hypothetical protein JKP88DRAFT_252872 [Tribonema minus]|uniref:Uncharacterized protein n=1 Tax=Tribonema minus TaxID=303371 RepID=A0A835ZBN8_9STRA|nr:hypothetical protein JKP88DRAFT_252872 [Tribonema minus]